jgi:hypothetical protein
VNLTLSGDHRVVDGMDLARFLEAFQHELDAFAAGASGAGQSAGGTGNTDAGNNNFGTT